jgi:hypothetical protein
MVRVSPTECEETASLKGLFDKRFGEDVCRVKFARDVLNANFTVGSLEMGAMTTGTRVVLGSCRVESMKEGFDVRAV